jgi:hypothetical protein
MRVAFDEVVTKLSLEHATLEMKAYLFQCVLEVADQGETRQEFLMADAARQMQDIIVALSGRSRFAGRTAAESLDWERSQW